MDNIDNYKALAEALETLERCFRNGCTIQNLESNIDRKAGTVKIPIEGQTCASIANSIDAVRTHFQSVPETKDEAEDKKLEAILQMIASKFNLSSADEMDLCVRQLINNEETIDKIAAMINQQHPGSIKDNDALFNYFIELMVYIGQEQSNANALFQNYKVLQSENANLKARVQSLETQINILTK